MGSETEPIPFSEYMERALYEPGTGFYAEAGRAGRRGDFVTSPEVGPLFGAVVARALDSWWRDLGRPDPFWVIEAGAGPGTLARSVASAQPDCAATWRYVAVERSAAQRAAHPDGVESRAELPSGPVTGVVLANELLDNVPFDLVYDGQPVLVDPRPSGAALVPDVDLDACQPDCSHARAWLAAALDLLDRGRVVVFDYAYEPGRPGWLRTYREHERGGHPLVAPGTQDITTDVPIDQLAEVRPPTAQSSQAEWLRGWGIDDLVEEGRRAWRDGAQQGDLASLRGRSRVREAEALLDPDGLGGFTVVEWRVNAV